MKSEKDEKDEKKEQKPRKLGLFLCWGLLLSTGIVCFVPLSSNDVWWHLAYGRWVGTHFEIPILDTFSWTHVGKPVAHIPWLSSLLFYALYSVGGAPILVAFKGLIAFLWGSLSFRLQRERGVPWFLFFLILFLAGLLAISRLSLLRALLTPFLLFPVMALMWERGKEEPWSLWRWGLVPVLLLWANCHGSFPLALVWLGLHLFWPLLWDLSLWKRFFLPSLGLFLAASLVTVLTPTGWFSWTSIVQIFTESSQYMNYQLTQEALPLGWDRLCGNRISALALGFLSIPPLLGLSWKKHGHTFCLWLIAWWFSFNQQRHVGLIAIFALLYMPGWLHLLQEQARTQLDSKRAKWAAQGFVFILGGLLLAAPFWLYDYQNSQHRPMFPSSLSFSIRHQVHPAAALKFLKEKRPKGKLYNTFFTGGYLIWFLPERKVFADGRTNILYSDRFFVENYGKHRMGDGKLPITLDRWKVSIALVTYGTLSKSLFADPRWVPVVYDDYTALFLKQTTGNDALITKFGYRYLKVETHLPSLLKKWQLLRKKQPQAFAVLKKELERALREIPYRSKKIRFLMRLYAAIKRQGDG